jgi:putative ABC transport system substrate-binding protein
MIRREFITLLGGAAVAWPLGARAADRKAADHRLSRIKHASDRKCMDDPFVQRLLELGWIDGRTVAVEYRWAEGRIERAVEIAAEFVRLKVNVITSRVCCLSH